MDKIELDNVNPAEPDKTSEKGSGSTDRRSFILGMAAGTVAAGTLGSAITGKAETNAGSTAPQMPCEDPFTRFSKAIVREIPLTKISQYLSQVGSFGSAAIGDHCGNGCGSGCGNNCLSAVDQAGYTELTLQQLNSIAADKTRLRGEVLTQIQRVTSSL